MLYLLYGQDSFRSREKLNEIIGRYKKVHKSGLNFNKLDLVGKNFDDFRSILDTISMFDEKKLIVLENTFSNKDFQKKFLEYAKNEKLDKDAGRIIVFIEERIENNDFFAELIKIAKIQEFKLLDGFRLKKWAQEKFKSRGTKIGNKALEKLIFFVGNDLWRMKNEIEKLIVRANGKEIKEEDVDLFVRPKIDTDIFKTIDAFATKNKKEALRLIRGHLERGDSELYLISMIAYQLKNILSVKALEKQNRPPSSFSKILNLHPFVVKKSFWQAKKFTESELKKIYQKLLKIDLDIKSGRVDPGGALEMLILDI